jgi:hypothetical protein
VVASTVRATINRFQAAGLSWPAAEELADAALEGRLFSDAGTKQGHRRQIEPDWARKYVDGAALTTRVNTRDLRGDPCLRQLCSRLATARRERQNRNLSVIRVGANEFRKIGDHAAPRAGRQGEDNGALFKTEQNRFIS